MASTWCFCQNNLLQCSKFTLKYADAFLTETPPALYSPGLTGATNTSLKGRGRAGMSLSKCGTSVEVIIFGVTCSIIDMLGGRRKVHHLWKRSKVWCHLSVRWLSWKSGGFFISSSYTICSLIYNKLSSLTWAQLNSSSVWAASTGKTFVTLFYLLGRAKTLLLYVTCADVNN